jgi:hypothetical protein
LNLGETSVYTEVASKLAVVGANVPFYSQAVSMAGANAIQAEVTMFSISGTSTPTLTVSAEASNDLQNWDDLGDFDALTLIGYGTKKFTDIAHGYVRLKFEMTGSSPRAIVGAGVNTANL